MVTADNRSAAVPGSDLDPEVRQFIRSVSSAMAGFLNAAEATHEERRARTDKVRTQWARGGPRMHGSHDRHVPTRYGNVRLRIQHAAPGRSPCLVYLHGGGWTMFSVDTHDRVMREYAARAGCTVIGIDYALAPEARYPTALHQVIDVLRWVRGQGHSLEIDTAKIAVGGDSAGANLAVAACLSLRDAGDGYLPAAMLLSYGAYSIECSAEACRRYGGQEYMLTCDEMSGFWRDYMRNETDARDPLVCPILARLEGLPPAFLTIAECDILVEQNVRMARRLEEAGVAVESAVYAGASHSFLEAVATAKVSDRALGEAAAWLRSVFAGGGSSAPRPLP